jgi:hypothetical protein
MARAALLAVLAGLLVAAQPAAAIPFGTNLNRPPSLAAGFCPDFVPFTPQVGLTCAWQSVNLQTGESPFPPAGTGVVTRISVRVGASTGPMQMVVLRGLRDPNLIPSDPNAENGFPGSANYVCCKAVAFSQVFVPTPGTTSTFAVNLPTRNDLAPDPTTNKYVGDFLALQVLAPNVRIPAAADPGAIAGGFFPAWQAPGEERAGVYGQGGMAVLFNGDWTPVAGGGDPAGAVPGFAPGPLVNGAMPIQLPGPGILRITDALLGRAAASEADATGSRRRSRIKAVLRNVTEAGTLRVRIKPSKTGAKALKRKRKLRVKLRITFTPAGSPASTTVTKTVTLKRSKAKRQR